MFVLWFDIVTPAFARLCWYCYQQNMLSAICMTLALSINGRYKMDGSSDPGFPVDNANGAVKVKADEPEPVLKRRPFHFYQVFCSGRMASYPQRRCFFL
jgi:hypothetical protein